MLNSLVVFLVFCAVEWVTLNSVLQNQIIICLLSAQY